MAYNASKKFTRQAAIRNVWMLSTLRYVAHNETATTDDVSMGLDINSSTARSYVADLQDLGLLEVDHLEPRTPGKPPVKVLRCCHDWTEASKEILPTQWKGSCASRFIARPDGQHLLADDYRAPVKPTTVKAVRDPLVACICGTGRAPSLNFTDSAKGG